MNHETAPRPCTARRTSRPADPRLPLTESACRPIAAVYRAAQRLIDSGRIEALPVPGMPGPLPLEGLLAYLTSSSRTPEQIDAVWTALAARARTDADWQVVALATAAPLLAKITLRAAGRRYAELREEIAAAVLAGFTESLLTLELQPGRGLVIYQLLRRAEANAKQVRRRAVAHDDRTAALTHADADDDTQERVCRSQRDERTLACGRDPYRPGHPDLALSRLVEQRVITRDEADLIGRHRIEHVTLRQLGDERGWYPMRTTRALRVAEAKVARALGHEVG